MTDTVNAPREPTREMVEAFFGCVEVSWGGSIKNFEEAYRAMLAAAPKAEPVAFGHGMLVVDTGTYGGEPAVFIAPARIGGPVGESSAIEGHAKDALQDGETVWTFPTDEQARRVADALVNAQPEAPKVEQEPAGYVDPNVLQGMRVGRYRDATIYPTCSSTGAGSTQPLYTHPAPSSDELLTGWAELQRLAEAASPGPWKACATIYEHMNCEIRTGAKGEGQPIGQIWDGPNAFADGQFIAAANPQVVLKLIAIAKHKGPQS